MATAAYESALHLAQSLSAEEKLRLIHELMISEPEGGTGSPSASTERRSILELSGLGATIWDGIDAQEYVHNERTSWDG